jgi:hypothetical protein
MSREAISVFGVTELLTVPVRRQFLYGCIRKTRLSGVEDFLLSLSTNILFRQAIDIQIIPST